LQDKIESSSKELQEKFELSNKKLDSLETRISQVQKKVQDGVKIELDKLNQRIDEENYKLSSFLQS
jgi:predicted  nucleic acid-binding Zn-ribbon protein